MQQKTFSTNSKCLAALEQWGRDNKFLYQSAYAILILEQNTEGRRCIANCYFGFSVDCFH
jgi:hypothetical protein